LQEDRGGGFWSTTGLSRSWVKPAVLDIDRLSKGAAKLPAEGDILKKREPRKHPADGMAARRPRKPRA